jgi:site-specific DNA recombinase
VSGEWFELARARLARNRETARRNARGDRYLLRGLVSCGHCRRGCVGRRLPPAYDYYLCRTQPQMGVLLTGERCRARYIPARQLEQLVWRDLCAVVRRPDMIARAMGRARGGHWLPQELQARRTNLRRGRDALAQQLERLTAAYLGSVMGLEEYGRRRAELEQRSRALARQEERLTAEADQRDEAARLAAHAEDFCRRVRRGLARADFTHKRELIELVVDRVVVTDDLVEIRYVVPTAPAGERQRFCQLRTDYLRLFPLVPGGRGVGEHAPSARDHAARAGGPRGEPDGGDHRHAEC